VQINDPQEEFGVLGISSDDAVKVWSNGELVHENCASRGLTVDNDRGSVTSKKGMNQLVLKIQNHGFEWVFCRGLLKEQTAEKSLETFNQLTRFNEKRRKRHRCHYPVTSSSFGD